ncbi:MAG: porin, partial [Bacteroidota bacterium]|nr:porin [Bacteroidota bacterium]
MKLLFILLVYLISLVTYAQVDTVSNSNNNTASPLTFSSYLEAYYAYDFNKPQNHQRPGFLYNFNRHNEFTINLAFLKAAYNSGKIRGNLALMAGTYAQYNLAAEP